MLLEPAAADPSLLLLSYRWIPLVRRGHPRDCVWSGGVFALLGDYDSRAADEVCAAAGAVDVFELDDGVE